MRAVVQRVARAAVHIDGAEHAAIGRGMLILLGVARGDGPGEAERLAHKCAALRIFPDDAKPMNRDLRAVAGQALVVSQFTLAADTRKGNRPGFSSAAPPAEAEPVYLGFVDALAQALGGPVATGVFGADMQIELCNDGPVTFVLEAAPAPAPAADT